MPGQNKGRKMKKRKRWLALLAGVCLAAGAELAFAWYGAGRGYGQEDQGSALEPSSVLDYEIADGRFRKTK